jgi:transcriptional regulator with GAF, ATPase, and Fis domain
VTSPHDLPRHAARDSATHPPLGPADAAHDHLEMLRRVTRQMVVAPDLPRVLDSIVTALVEHTGAVVARVFLYFASEQQCAICRGRGASARTESSAGEALHLWANAGAQTDVDGPWHLMPLSLPTVGAQVAKARRAELVNDVWSDARFQTVAHVAENLRALDVHAAAMYPLDFRGELLGMIGMLSRRPVATGEFELLGIFADQAAMAIKSSYLLGEVERSRARLAVENEYLQAEIKEERGFGGIIGASPALRHVLNEVRQVARVDTTVLLTGETGTGKEVVARAIHEGSLRKERPLIKVNCGAIPHGVVESELFGHEKGAFTGALQRRVGRFELADKGTLFMDEVAELPAETQVKLLRVLQEQEFERVGSTRPIRVDVRLVAATNRDLEREAREGRFRSDLFYRLHVFPIHLPPLRERTGDIPLLVAHLLAQLQRKLAKPLTEVTPSSMRRLQAYSWPGNVRELQNVLERASVLATGPVVEIDDVLREPASQPPVSGGETAARPLTRLDENERAHIRRALVICRGRISGPKGAAALLGINANTLRARMRKLGIDAHEAS